MRTRALSCLLVLLAASNAGAEVTQRIMRVAGATVEYKLVLPNGYDAANTYPAILVFGGGPQTMNTIDGALARNFQAEAERRGYLVIGPAAPNGDLFFYDGERVFPEFLDNILAAHKIEGGKFHVAGPSNGGIAAMHVAAKYPQYFLSATAFPGQARQPGRHLRVSVHRRERRLPLARRDGARSGIPALARKRGAIHRRKGPAAPARDTIRYGCEPPVRGL